MKIATKKKKKWQKYRLEHEESNGVICFSIGVSFHIETTFFRRPPYKIAGVIELGNENS